MNKIISCHRRLISGKWKNDETGLIRHFMYPPTRGKWTRISFDKREFPVDMNGVWWYC